MPLRSASGRGRPRPTPGRCSPRCATSSGGMKCAEGRRRGRRGEVPPPGQRRKVKSMRPNGFRTRVFLDGGDPGETRAVLAQLGFLDGQTTNPTLISRNPAARKLLEPGVKFTPAEALGFYRDVVREIAGLLPDGSVSIEVYADGQTGADAMLRQGREMFSWVPNAHVKFPVTRQGLTAAHEAAAAGLRVNMTLCFSQEQAAAVYGATRGAAKGRVLVSPFIGRLDDRGENGIDLI